VAHVEQGGGLVVRFDRGTPEFLLTTAKRNSSDWLFPKGHIEKDETAAETAIREVREETGMEAALVAPIGAIEFHRNREEIRVEFYLLRYTRRVGDAEPPRQIRWCAYEEALALLTYESTKEILRKAWPIVAAAG
jgi:tRNA nucleotidyltransferase (CCA-adding enzyme)